MRIGYSFWGFLGPGITDTPDGGRSHRRPFIDAIRAAGHQVVFLQPNRDLAEAGDRAADRYPFDPGLPEIDVLFAEWRWPIPGRNTTTCGARGHTCDLHRQADLLNHYTHTLGTPTVIWDKDLKLPPTDPLRQHHGVVVCEAALIPSARARPLLFPLDDALLDEADAPVLTAQSRPLPLTYIGNQYDRDQAFDRYFAPAAAHLPHRVAGKWRDARRWPEVSFLGRVPFSEVSPMYSESLATVLLLPERYAAVGQMTQRIFEAVLAGCLPLAPSDIARIRQFVPDELIVHDGMGVIDGVHRLMAIAGTAAHTDLISACLARLDMFRLSRQIRTLETILGAFDIPLLPTAGRRR